VNFASFSASGGSAPGPCLGTVPQTPALPPRFSHFGYSPGRCKVQV